MRKKLGILMIILLFLTGCGRAKETITDSTEKDETEAVSTDKRITLSGEWLGYPHLSDCCLKEKLILKGGVEAQRDGTGLFYPSMAFLDNTIYVLNQDCISCIDLETQKMVPLCNKPNCRHEDEDCNAVFLNKGYWMANGFIQADQGMLYTFGYNDSGMVSLFRINPDGSGFTNCMDLYQADLTDPTGQSDSLWVQPEVLICEGYVYYIIPDQEVSCIRRKKIGQEEEEIICVNDYSDALIYRLKAYDGYIFFQAGSYTDTTHETVDGGIYSYDPETAKLCLIQKNAIAGYGFIDNCLVFKNENDVIVHDMYEANVDRTIAIRTDFADLATANKRLYMFYDTKGMLEVYNLEGESMFTSQTESSIYAATLILKDQVYGLGYSSVWRVSTTGSNSRWIEIKE